MGAYKMKNLSEVGRVYAFKSARNVYYYAVAGIGGDFLFLDHFSDKIETEFVESYFLRLFVAYPSIRRAKWKFTGSVISNGEPHEKAFYMQRPVGADPFVCDPTTGRSISMAPAQAELLETMAVWDASHHILPILDYHFFREPTPLANMIKSKKL